MSESVSQVSGTEGSQGPQGPDPTNASGKPAGEPATQMVSNFGQMQAQQPEIWNEMLKAFAQELCNKWQKFPERLKKIRQEAERR